MTSRSVLREIAEQLEAAAEQDPRFWAGIREELGRARMEQGARQHSAVQTAGPLLDVAVQVAPTTEERATQTGRATEARQDSTDSEASEEDRPPTRPWPPDGCWNCANVHHLYSECPRPRATLFCYRCDRLGTTIKDCPRCQEDWRAQGPYRPGRGHEGPEPSRRTRPPTPRERAARPPH
jgi:hypothetical protein